MSGHSKWATIKRKKGALDAKRGQLFTKLIKEITVAARQGGGDPAGNPRLRLAIDNAKSANMPQDNIDRAVKKATGELEGVTYTEIMYEGYGPGGIAILVECVTDNKNRSIAEVRHIFSKNGGNMGEANSVAWMFDRKGIISLPAQGKTEDEVMELVLEAGADDLNLDEDYFEVSTSVENFEPVRKLIVDAGLTVENASIQWVARNLISVKGEDADRIERILEALEDSDDVQNVYSNADVQE